MAKNIVNSSGKYMNELGISKYNEANKSLQQSIENERYKLKIDDAIKENTRLYKFLKTQETELAAIKKRAALEYSQLQEKINKAQTEAARQRYEKQLEYAKENDEADIKSYEASIKKLEARIAAKKVEINDLLEELDEKTDKIQKVVQKRFEEQIAHIEENINTKGSKKAKIDYNTKKIDSLKGEAERISILSEAGEISEEEAKNLLENIGKQITEAQAHIKEANNSENLSASEQYKLNERTFSKGLLNTAADISKEKQDEAQETLNKLYERIDAGEDISEEELETAKDNLDEAKKQSKLLNDLKKLNKLVSDQISAGIAEAGKYQSAINTRLMGTDKSYKKIASIISSNLTSSLTVSQAEMFENLNKLVDLGVAYNIEQRSYLMTLGDKIVSTFDATNETLLRLIRLQQSDTTAVRAGIESSLNKFLNNMFQDTSYLTNVYDTVSAALIDANSLMTREMSAEFEYIVQKWFGSLTSVGISSSAVQSIAQGINYLATGDTQALASNSSLMNLMAMGASRAGLQIDQLFNNITPDTANTLLYNIVTYLQEVSNGSTNVVRSAYGDLFNLSTSDLRAISNLTSTDLTNILNNTLTYEQAYNEIQSQILTAASRQSFNEGIQTLKDNFLYTLGTNIGSSPVLNTLWTMNNIIQQVTGGIKLPVPTFMGTGLPEFVNLTELIQQGIITGDLLGAGVKLGQSIANSAKTPGLEMWADVSSSYTRRGTGFIGNNNVQNGTSYSGDYTTSASMDDLEAETLRKTKEDADKNNEIMNNEALEAKTADDIYKELFVEEKPIHVIVSGMDGSMNVYVTNPYFDEFLQNGGNQYKPTNI